MARRINILLTGLDGLDFPSTLCLPQEAHLPISSLTTLISSRLPSGITNLTLSTNTTFIDPNSTAPISSLCSSTSLLPLQLSVLLPGGKGGFGSQLRAAGGRMSSRKNRRDNRDPNASSRNLDGRRLRTVTEAKSLAEYLATKPEMDRREREERRKRWEAVVESAERREEEIKTGKKNVRLDGEWVERKEEEEGKTRDAIAAMLMDSAVEERTGSESEVEGEGSVSDENMDVVASGSGSSEGADDAGQGTTSFFGWDEEEVSSDEEEDGEGSTAVDDAGPAYEGKGKGRA